MVLPELEKIRKKRNALGLSQQKLATDLRESGVNLSRVVINRIENRKDAKPKKKKYSPSYDVVKSIFDYLERLEQTEMADGGLPVKLAGEVMVSPLVTVSLEESLETARKKMGSDGEITQLPVIVNGECVGLVTSNSILNKPPGAKLVKQVIESIPPIIAENMKVTEQVKALVTNSPCVLVSEKNSSKIKGIIVAWDLISTKGYNTWKKDKNWKKNGKYIFYRDITRSRIVKEVSRK